MIGLEDGSGRICQVAGLTRCVILPDNFAFFFNPTIENGEAIFDEGKPYERRCAARETTVGQVAPGTHVLLRTSAGRWRWLTVREINYADRFDLLDIDEDDPPPYEDEAGAPQEGAGEDDSGEVSLTAERGRLLELS